MVVTVPNEPIRMPRYFTESVVTRNQIGLVFKDHIARSIWLLIKSGHATTHEFNRWCLNISVMMKVREWDLKPTPEQLYYLVYEHQPFASTDLRFLSPDFEESRAWLERLARAVTGEEPVRYEVRVVDFFGETAALLVGP